MKKIIVISLCFLQICCLFINNIVFAESSGSVQKQYTQYIYKFDEKNKYLFEDGELVIDHIPLGELKIKGDYEETEEGFIFKKNNLSIEYDLTFDNITDQEDIWYVAKDDLKSINGKKINDKIGSGAFLLQVSRDGVNWITKDIRTNLYGEESKKTIVFDGSKEEYVQYANNGFYYRVIIAYKMERCSIKTGFFGMQSKDIEANRYAEVYEFYVYNNESSKQQHLNNKKEIPSSGICKCKEENSFSNAVELKNGDLNYGWSIGKFSISGFTSTITNDNEINILKNPNDKVALWFTLNSDIDKLNDDSSLSIVDQTNVSDQSFETNKMDFGRGTMIIRKTSGSDDEYHNPIIYTNFLSACVDPSADTLVYLFEDGEYEVCLDYMIEKEKFGFNKKESYSILFKFIVSNSSSMIYPFDLVTHEKLYDDSYTKNGFSLDFVGNENLLVNYRRSILKDGENGITENIVENQQASNGDKFTEEGLYTIDVINKSIGPTATMKIYVGENNLLKAHNVTGLSISDINKYISAGAIVKSDGTLDDKNYDENVIKFDGLDDKNLIDYTEDSIYMSLIEELNDNGYCIDDIKSTYYPKDYIENLSNNTKKNIYYGYSIDDLDKKFSGEKYIFTLGDDGKTVVKKLETINNELTSEIFKNIAIGGGVIVTCITISLLTVENAPAISIIFAASAYSGTKFGISSGIISGICATIIEKIKTGDTNFALNEGLLAASEGFKYGVIVGTIEGGSLSAIGLKSATSTGLSMNEVAKIQMESKYPLDVIGQFHSYKEYEALKKANLKPEMVNGKIALINLEKINWKKKIDEYGQTNYERILKGLAPLDNSGKTYELHHIGQEADATLALLTQTEHDDVALHGFKKISEIDRNAFAKIRREFYLDLAKMVKEAGLA